MSTPRILPCPYCWHPQFEPELKTHKRYGWDCYTVTCLSCGAQGNLDIKYADEAIRRWNQASEAVQKAAELRQLADDLAARLHAQIHVAQNGTYDPKGADWAAGEEKASDEVLLRWHNLDAPKTT